MSIYITVYTKEKGKLDLTKDEWIQLRVIFLTYHRKDGPAREWTNGDKHWYINGERHREDGPAIECSNGDKEWYINGKLHREDGPAREWTNGDKHWYINGKRHREDGPAIEYPKSSYGNKYYWFINNIKYFETTYNKLLKEIDSLEPILGLIDPRDWVRKRFERKYKDKI